MLATAAAVSLVLVAAQPEPEALPPLAEPPAVDPELVALVREAPSAQLVTLVAADPRLAGLNARGRRELLEHVVASPNAPAQLVNLFVGFGAGSFAEGDGRGAVLFATDVAAILIGLHAFTRGVGDAVAPGEDEAGGWIDPDTEGKLALLGLLASRVAGVWLPTTYPGRRHEALDDAFRALDLSRQPGEQGPGLSPSWQWSLGAATDRGIAPGATLALRF